MFKWLISLEPLISQKTKKQKVEDGSAAPVADSMDLDNGGGSSSNVTSSNTIPADTHSARKPTYEKLGVPADLASDIGANVSGWYELVAVLTHVGRTAESGHYIGWVKDDKGHWCKSMKS